MTALFLIRYLLLFVLVNLKSCVDGISEGKSGGVFLTNLQLKRLIEENVLKKGDIAKVPCIRRSRRCLVQSIKRRGWKNQKKLNHVLNKILDIKDEDKFIDQVIRLMVEDNSDLLREAKNDKDILTKQSLKHFHKTYSKTMRKTKKSEISGEMDFLNTYENLNDFNENDEDNDDSKYLENIFREEHKITSERNTVKVKADTQFETIDETIKKSFVEIPSMTSSPYDYQDLQEDESMFQQENEEFSQPDDTMGSFSNNNEGTEQLTFDQPNKLSRENIVSSFIADQDKLESLEKGEQESYLKHHAHIPLYDKKKKVGHKSMKMLTVRNQTFYDSMTNPNPSVLEKLKLEAQKHMKNMTNINITKSKTTHNKKNYNNRLKLKSTKKVNQKKQQKQDSQEQVKTQEGNNQYLNNQNFESQNLNSQNIGIQNLNSQNIGTQNLNSQNIGTQNLISQNIGTQNLNSQTSTKNVHDQTLSGDFKDQGDLHDPVSSNEEGESDASGEQDFQQSLTNLQSGWELEDLDDKNSADDDDNGDDSSGEDGDEDTDDEEENEKIMPTKGQFTIATPSIQSSPTQRTSTRKTAYINKTLNTVFPENSYDPYTYNDNEYQNNVQQVNSDSYGNGGGYDMVHSNTQQVDGSMPADLNNAIVHPSQESNKGPTIGIHKTEKPDPSKKGQIKATRVCKPGVPKSYLKGKRNCLIIGDSIALAYSYTVATALSRSCQVQLAPSSKAGVALDSRYGLQCLNMLLSTIDLLPTYYDVILFNFGLHDINYLESYPEEFHNITGYKDNLRKIKKRLLLTGATVGFILSTPVTFDAAKDKLITKYNHAAKLVMEEDRNEKIYTVNLHKIVIKECGKTPFENCYMMKKPHDVHYGVTGSIMLGKRVATFTKFLLQKHQLKLKDAEIAVPQLFTFSNNATSCPKPGTRCPSGYTCMHNIVSRSGQACCGIKHGIDCGNSWHCCPPGTKCHAGCTDKMCSCIT